MIGWAYFAAVVLFSTPVVQNNIYTTVDNATATILNIQPDPMNKAVEKGYLGSPKSVAWAAKPKEIERKIVLASTSAPQTKNPTAAKTETAATPKKAKKAPSSIDIEKSGHIEDLGLLNEENASSAAATDEILTYFEKKRMTKGENEVRGAFIVPNQESAQPVKATSRASLKIE